MTPNTCIVLALDVCVEPPRFPFYSLAGRHHRRRGDARSAQMCAAASTRMTKSPMQALWGRAGHSADVLRCSLHKFTCGSRVRIPQRTQNWSPTCLETVSVYQ